MDNYSDEGRLLGAMYARIKPADPVIEAMSLGKQLGFHTRQTSDALQKLEDNRLVHRSLPWARLLPHGLEEGARLWEVHQRDAQTKVLVEIYKRSNGDLKKDVVIDDLLDVLVIPEEQRTAFFNRLQEQRLVTRVNTLMGIHVRLRAEGKERAVAELRETGELASPQVIDPPNVTAASGPNKASEKLTIATANKMASIFLSHSSKDKFFVRRLAQELQARGIRVWLDEAEINVGDSLTEKIGAAIDEMDFVGVVLSANSVNSKWVQVELQAALNKEIAKRKVVVLPMLLAPVEIPTFLKDKKYADFTDPDKFAEALSLVLRALGVIEGSETITTFLIKESVKAVQIPADPAAGKVVQTQKTKTPTESRLEAFEDIRITGIDDELTNRPDPAKMMYNVYLTLSADPPEDWAQIFEAERRFPRHTMWRRAWIEGQAVVVYCPLDEVEKHHLSDLKTDVTNTNQKFRTYLVEQAQRERQQILKADDEKSSLDRLKKNLKFD